MKTHNHRELCEIGAKFLKRPESSNGHGCHFVVIEPSCYGENPDVFGVRHGAIGENEYNGNAYAFGHDVGTVLIEAKTSRSDFLVDRKKSHRINPETGVGKWRYYICPTGLIKPTELPEKWGLIYVNGRGHCEIVVGAMAVPKEKRVSEWNGKPLPVQRFRDHKKLVESFTAHTFHDRNIQNEQNLLTMALARLGDAERLLYMQREFNSMSLKLDSLERENQRLSNELGLKDRLIAHYKARAEV